MEPAVGLLQIRELFRIQDFSLADQSNTTERQRHVVRSGKLLLFFQVLIQLLSDSRVSTVATDQDISVVCAVVMASNHYTVLVLQKRKDLHAQMNTVCRNLTQ